MTVRLAAVAFFAALLAPVLWLLYAFVVLVAFVWCCACVRYMRTRP